MRIVTILAAAIGLAAAATAGSPGCPVGTLPPEEAEGKEQRMEATVMERAGPAASVVATERAVFALG